MGWQDDYELVGLIDKGSIGDVFEVRKRASGNIFALKELKFVHVADDEIYSRFIHEIELMKPLDHANVVPIIASDVNVPQPYYVMPKYQSSLKSLRDKGDVLPRAIFRPLIEALRYMHARNLAHRDIHPGNILFDGTTFLIADFSLGKVIGVDSFNTYSSLGGVAGYAAPEQSGRNRTVDTRADIYALGGILIFVSTGLHPNDISIENVPADYRAIVRQCREPEPHHRYQTIDDLSRALDLVWDHQRAWGIRERLRSFATTPVAIENASAMVQDMLCCVSDEWFTIVNCLNAMGDDDFKSIIAIRAFGALFEDLRTQVLHRVPFSQLDPYGIFLARVAREVPDLYMAVRSVVTIAEVGYYHNQFSYGRYFRQGKDAGERFDSFAKDLDAEMLSMSDESRWLARQ